MSSKFSIGTQTKDDRITILNSGSGLQQVNKHENFKWGRFSKSPFNEYKV